MVFRPLLWLIAAAGVARAAAPAPVALDPKVHDVLAASTAFYAGKKSLEADLSSAVYMTMTGMKQEMDTTFHLALLRPNSFAFAAQSGLMGGTLVSDGKTVVTYLPALHKYTSATAPDNVVDLFQPMTFGMVQGTPLSLGINTLLGKDPLAQFAERLQSSQDLGVEQLNGVAARHVRLVNPPFTTDLWFADGAAPVLLQAGGTMDMSAGLKHLTDEQRKKMPAGISSMTMSRTTTFSNWKFDQPLAAATFTFQPPPDAQLVTEFVPQPVHPLTGKPAPDFTLASLDGAEVPLASLRGKTVVLDFWATWCGPCVAALPIITQVTSSFHDKGVVFYAVNLRESADTIRQFQKTKGLTFPVLLDQDGSIAKLYGAKGIPQTVLIDGSGKVQAVHVGYDPNLKTILTKQLDDILAGKQLAAAPVAPATAPH